jgi:hypothetical protein
MANRLGNLEQTVDGADNADHYGSRFALVGVIGGYIAWRPVRLANAAR